ncbi:MAG: thiol-disulfide oxidoreductase DCC family protein [Pyrinomonadaceae bacterium]
MQNLHSIVLFDGVCNLCSASVQFIIKRDPAKIFKFAPLQSATGRELINRYGLMVNQLSSVVLIENDKAYTRSTAALRVAKKLNGLWSLMSLLLVIPVFVRDFFYNLVAMNRYRIFGWRDECMMPTPEVRERFLP